MKIYATDVRDLTEDEKKLLDEIKDKPHLVIVNKNDIFYINNCQYTDNLLQKYVKLALFLNNFLK